MERLSIPQWIRRRSLRALDVSALPSPSSPAFDAQKHATIFVAIAAFRDPECSNTVLQCMEHAQFPDRLRFGIFTQNDISDVDCGDFRDTLNCDDRSTLKKHALCGRLWQMKIERIDFRDGLGPTYGRYRAELFFAAEDYVLQMDSHTAFVQHWDTTLIAMHNRLNNDFGIITTYPKPLKSFFMFCFFFTN